VKLYWIRVGKIVFAVISLIIDAGGTPLGLPPGGVRKDANFYPDVRPNKQKGDSRRLRVNVLEGVALMRLISVLLLLHTLIASGFFQEFV
jgi:hypothetical protein